MAVYLDVFNLIINKILVIEKYSGGIEQFRIDYDIPLSKINKEDDELFCLGQMNADQFDIDSLTSKGLSFDSVKQKSDDFVILYLYAGLYWGKEQIKQNKGLLWEANWIEHNGVFAWHIETSKDILLKVDEISNMTIEEICEQIEIGNNLLKTIRIGDL